MERISSAGEDKNDIRKKCVFSEGVFWYKVFERTPNYLLNRYRICDTPVWALYILPISLKLG
jgi:hypothetical protein